MIEKPSLAMVSKTGGRRFEPCHSCQLDQRLSPNFEDSIFPESAAGKVMGRRMALPLPNQKFIAFEGLMTWAHALVTQADRLSAASTGRMNGFIGAVQDRRAGPGQNRELGYVFFAERLFFCHAAAKFFEHRDWVVELGLLDRQLFVHVDVFAEDAKAMRNLNDHAREYFKGPGLLPQKWKANFEQFSSDPTGTKGTMIGGRLDWVRLRDAVALLIPTIPDRLPEIFSELSAQAQKTPNA
jgi:hypothetical protein